MVSGRECRLMPRATAASAADRSSDLGQQPVAEGADLRHVAARFGIDQPVGVAVVADQVEGLDQPAVGELGRRRSAGVRIATPWPAMAAFAS